ncbi:hypothetical protein [Maribacter sp. HTCC2170]|uniref:hypothetical protein n=1 Tax=Maribacter sp. (strain HTCC2170 / KCCM 42371) TaxID=313603 RepID=UPI00006BD2C2|nr:hypothetical protein [Maribacter sp. HTCC2170]EAR02548.1 hypothetical protein FB2170_04655 [Maribacter sp. HTCC2170]
MAKKRHGFWNVVIVLTVVICLTAFTIHYKNWTKIEQDEVKILSGFYYKKLNFSEIDSVIMIEKIPPMERLNGFSALQKEKGLFREFKDSLTDKKIHVYVDNLENKKIKVVYNDSAKLYLNYADSLKTQKLFTFLKGKIQNIN